MKYHIHIEKCKNHKCTAHDLSQIENTPVTTTKSRLNFKFSVFVASKNSRLQVFLHQLSEIYSIPVNILYTCKKTTGTHYPSWDSLMLWKMIHSKLWSFPKCYFFQGRINTFTHITKGGELFCHMGRPGSGFKLASGTKYGMVI